MANLVSLSWTVSTMSKTQPNGITSQERAPPVVGINFGNSYASIAVLNKVPPDVYPLPVAQMIFRMACPIASQTKMESVK